MPQPTLESTVTYDPKVTAKSALKLGAYGVALVLLDSSGFIEWAAALLDLPPVWMSGVVLPALAGLRSVVVAYLRVNLGGLLGTPK